MMDRFTSTNGITLHWLDHPAQTPGGPTLVLSHGLSANAHSFGGLIAAGLNRRMRVIAVDLRGRGLSDKPATGYSMAAHSADLLGLLDVLELDSVVLGGHSFGGLLSIYTAAHAPERVERLVIMDAAGSLHPNVRELIKPSLARLGRVRPSWATYRDEMRAAAYWHGIWNAEIERYYRADVHENADGTVRAHSSPAAIAEAIELALAEPWAQFQPRVRQPAILLNATGSYGLPDTPAILPPDGAMELVNHMPDCRYVALTGNHMTMLFAPHAAEAVAAIEHFIFGN